MALRKRHPWTPFHSALRAALERDGREKVIAYLSVIIERSADKYDWDSVTRQRWKDWTREQLYRVERSMQ